jgi:prepilin-type N-terminal cleavage/methylation domain-containing protein
MHLAVASRTMRTRHPTGFTLIEMATVMILASILVAIGFNALANLKSRGNFASATGNLIVGLRKTRAAAYARGTTTVFVIDTAGGRFWGIEDVNGAFNLTTFDPNNPTPAGFNPIVDGTLPTGPSGVTFTGATNGYGSALPQPYAGIPSFSGSTATPNFAYCSFCKTNNPNLGFGSISFDASGGARFNSGPAAVGQSFTVNGQALMTVAVISRTGTAETFQNPP